MPTQIEQLDASCSDDGETWYTISGTDYSSGYEFEGIEFFAVTSNDEILDCDGHPLTPGGIVEIAVRNAFCADELLDSRADGLLRVCGEIE